MCECYSSIVVELINSSCAVYVRLHSAIDITGCPPDTRGQQHRTDVFLAMFVCSFLFF